jgi:hypothetical protein
MNEMEDTKCVLCEEKAARNAARSSELREVIVRCYTRENADTKGVLQAAMLLIEASIAACEGGWAVLGDERVWVDNSSDADITISAK